ncbi:hypothetical protein LAZ67_6000826 [Cordylochernes scorpioides]|uniref:Tetraspanin n=1 Tax=Cordylochernes scorpioides TaxID=51811 RepID=A0ABY6KIW0_9ARAC|nr:hypothetical protein LAZ67_6000826 [Cordylochernes scorpioides]
MARAIIQIVMSDERRDQAITLLFVLSFLGILIGITNILLVIYLFWIIQPHVSFLEEFYNHNLYPAYIGILGTLQLLQCLFSIWTVWELKQVHEKILQVLEKDKKKGHSKGKKKKKLRKKTRKKLTQLEKKVRHGGLVPYFLGLGILVALLVLGAVILSFLEVWRLESAFGKALSRAMDKYKTDVVQKEQIDMVQIEYKCCGIDSHTDWFKISFIDKKFVDLTNWQNKIGCHVSRNVKGGEYIANNVPFSCCNPEFMGDCVTENVSTSIKSLGFKSRMTVYITGCREALMDFFGDQVLLGIGLFVICNLIIWVCTQYVTKCQSG